MLEFTRARGALVDDPPPFASAQTGLEIMKKVAETYGSLKTYHFEARW